MFKVGKLYICEQYFLLLYPDQEAAAAAAADGDGFTSCGGGVGAAYLTRKLEKPVYYTEKKVPLLVLNNKKEYIEVLAGDKKGWIIFDDYLNIKEIDCA